MIRIHNKLPHTPHITLETNLQQLPSQKKLDYFPQEMKIYIGGRNPTIFTRQYRTDPLSGWGFMCNVPTNKIKHDPHLTIAYSKEEFKNIPNIKNLPFYTIGSVVVADTHSHNPWEWKIINIDS